MTTWREDDSGGPPPRPEGSHDPVAGLPPEWGQIVIPDDAAELDREASRVRRELRWAGRGRHRTGSGSLFRAPLVIVALTLLLALSSLLSIMGPLGRSPQAVEPARDTDPALRDISLTDQHGGTVRIGDHLPAAVLLLDGCPCTELADAVLAAAPAGVSVLLISRQLPAGSGPGIRLADPTGKVRTAAGAGMAVPTEATVLLLDDQGQLERLLPGTASVDDFRTELGALQG
jgi:hypothetical protein